MIKCNISQMVDYPIHTAVFVMDLTVLLFHRPPFLFSLVMFGVLLWLTMFFVLKSERSDRFRLVYEPQSSKPVASAPAVAEPEPEAAVATVAIAEAQQAAPTRSAASSPRRSTRKKD